MAAKRQIVKSEIIPIRGEQAKSVSPADRLPDFPIVSQRQLAILKFLADARPTAFPQIDIAAGVGYETRRAAQRHLRPLAENGLIDHDQRKGGYFATELGRQLVDFVFSEK